jgi:hypothetical protein
MKRWNPCRPCCPEEEEYDPCFACGNCPTQWPANLYGTDPYAMQVPDFGGFIVRFPSMLQQGSLTSPCFHYLNTGTVTEFIGTVHQTTWRITCSNERIMCRKICQIDAVTVYDATVEASSVSCAPRSLIFRFPSQAVGQEMIPDQQPWPAHDVVFNDGPAPF